MRRQIGEAGVLIDTEVIEHPTTTDHFRLSNWMVGLRFDLHSHEQLFRSTGVVKIAALR